MRFSAIGALEEAISWVVSGALLTIVVIAAPAVVVIRSVVTVAGSVSVWAEGVGGVISAPGTGLAVIALTLSTRMRPMAVV